MTHSLPSLYQQLIDLLREEEEALRYQDEEHLECLSEAIQNCWQKVDAYTGAMPAGLSREQRSQLASLLSQLRRQVDSSRQAWLSYQHGLKEERKAVTTARRYVAETKQQPSTGGRFSRSA